MILVDVHAHLDSRYFPTDADAVVERAKAAGIIAIVTNGIDMDTNRDALALAKKHGMVKAALGIYPPDLLEKEVGKKRLWEIGHEIAFIKENIDKIIAIGEIGLDYSEEDADKALQAATFTKLVELAKLHDKPILVHSRKAEKDVIDILEKVGHSKVIMHCFSGNHKLVERVRQNRWYFSIPTNIVRSEHFQKIARETPMSQLLTETDSPFLSPFREKQNEPAFIIEAVKKIAEVKSMEPEEVANLVYMNYQRLFL